MTDITKADLEEMWEKMKDYNFNTDNYITTPKGSPVTIQAEEYRKLKALENAITIIEDDEDPREGDLIWATDFSYNVVYKQDRYSPNYLFVYDQGHMIEVKNLKDVQIIQRNGKSCIYRSKLPT